MAASKDLRLIAKIADVGELKPVIDAGITEDKFKDQDARLMFSFIMRYYKKRATSGNVPDRQILEDRFPAVDLPPVDRLRLSSSIEEFLEADRKARVQKLVDYVSTWADSPDKMLPYAQQEISELLRDKRTSVDIDVSGSLLEVQRRYEESKHRDVLKGIPYPWAVLNRETQGMQNGEYIIFYGRPKSLKTFVGLKVSVHAYQEAHRRVLIYTREMTPEQMMDRIVCMLIRCPYDAFKQGYLHKIEHPCGGNMEDALYDTLSTLRQDESTLSIGTKQKKLIITSDRQDRDGGGVNGLRRKIEDHEPDLVFVDAVYLMRNDRSGIRSVKWSDQAAISQDLKEIAQDFNIPLVATLQANRGSETHKGESTANMAYSDAYAQDCDLAAEIIKKRIDPQHNHLALGITASREANLAGFAIHGDPCENFGQLYMPVTDKYGTVQLGENGEPMMEPVIFQDTSDIWKMFKRNETERDSSAPKIGPGVDKVRSMIGEAKTGSA
jgi:hypothetical protein